MGKKRVVEALTLDTTSWTAPAGCTRVKALTYLTFDRVIANGWTTTYVGLPSGRVLCAGGNTKGQYGDETVTGQADPAPRYDVEFPEIGHLAGGEFHSSEIAHNGIMWTMGLNDSGQLGSGNTTARSVPIQVVGSKVWRASAHGQSSTFALDGDYKIWCWGINGSGQGGDGTVTSRSIPTAVVGSARKYKQISGGAGYCLAVEWTTNLLYAWGQNTSGQLGDGTVVPKSSPIAVAGAKTWARVEAGDTHNLGIDTAGVVWAWGNNDDGQLGDGTAVKKSSPIAVLGLPALTWVDVACGDGRSYFLASDGQVYAVGLNTDGQLGDGTVVKKSSPVKVLGTGAGTLIMGRISAGNQHVTCVTKDGSKVWTWGLGTNGRLGNGAVAAQSSPVLFGALQTYTRTYNTGTRRLMDTKEFTVVPGTTYTLAMLQEIMLFNSIPITEKTLGGIPEVELEYFKS